MTSLKFTTLCIVVVSLGGVSLPTSHADQPSHYRAADGTLQCSIWATGKSSKRRVDLDSPLVVSGFNLTIRPSQQRVYLVATGGYGKDALVAWRESLMDMAGSTITYQMGNSEPVDLTLPLTWSPQIVHGVHDGEEAEKNFVLFDITRSPLGKRLLEIEDNPAPLAIKHQAVFDHGYRINKPPLRFRMGSDTTTITFKHFAESKAYCARANSTGGFARWFGD